jgi:ubiquinone/menaquinone biosynthesis C-methylase UbiE
VAGSPATGPGEGGRGAAQALDWNGPTGQRWAAAHGRVEQAFRPLTEAYLARLAPEPGSRVLDVGCGAGDLSLAVAALVGRAGHVLGLDISAPLLGVARSRGAAAVASVAFLAGDAAATPLPADRDLLVSRFGVMFFDDPPGAFRHLRGALRPGGRLSVLCWRSPGENPWAQVPMGAAAEVIGPAEPAAAGAPGAFAFADPDRVRRILADAGFSAVEATSVDADVVLGTGPDGDSAVSAAADYAATLTPVSRRLAELDETTRLRVSGRIADALRPFRVGEAVRLPAGCWIYEARAPG